MQTTLRRPVALSGIGLHTGRPARVTISPAAAELGIWFHRTDVKAADPYIAARWDGVEQVPLCTRLVNEDGVSVSTVEHLMAALAGCGVHNAMIEVTGPEIPILDGSAAAFAQAILGAGVRRLDTPVRALRVCRPVEVAGPGGALARIEPAEGLSIAFEIDFADAAIGRQRLSLDMGNGAFVRELCDSRTFCRAADIDRMRAAGLALGGTLDNAVVVEGDRVLSPGGLRHSDEPVRHKMLDALGDLALAGAPLLGAYTGRRAGHALTNGLLRALFATPGAVEWVECDAECQRRLPGMGVRLADLAAVA
ncbi:UDP-3-O-acyl-N-acetylglucosamine deacetylase [Rhodovulum sp. 12E13]|uniref:UDP-3-O-acyl-N-acetylglucosamine deacetylase n=1 Tax=Rhodovulum sp. 12E13 TaxID=2203891 RepID=UPI000E17CCA6|nr:UDP-3-O-acyl-N-acetylglucosamine deacetylase [Rhodovulum sp. 12E13]RDC72759.1 UDP-3-O-acyl-N-acetylglucosamine deacetylase [Rhodovulum sp. 12E13]